MNLDERLDNILEGAIPGHVAIIPDGNGRWAHNRGLERTEGHKRGTKRAEDLIEFIAEKLPIEYLTFYTFSTENWSRPDSEVKFLMTLLKDLLGKRGGKLLKNDVRLRVIGDVDGLPDRTAQVVRKTMDKTSSNEGLRLILALNYGGRQEILTAAKELASQVTGGELSSEEITEEIFQSHLYTSGIPDPDLLIRTSGERRLSNFMLWQLAYTEMWITEEFWPSFKPENFLEAISDFQQRERRFGRVDKGKYDQ
ncbi:isoprenyl transferase [Candidatus Bipolaricaulota bacterium]|nr:isoprenyl transferase [Candidatus Bipolaricaulota bacterium]